MAALLVAMSVMAVLMTVAMPVWRQAAQREKEEELVFRGRQYARAIGLFERKYANTPPPTLDVLVQEHFLRKRFKDPITNADFVPIPAAQAQSATPGATPTPVPPVAAAQASGAGAAAAAFAGRGGGVIGVTSASTARSIRIYNGASRYSDWRFVYTAPTPTPGTTAAGPGGGQGGRQGQGRQGTPQAAPMGAPGAGGPPSQGRGRGPQGGNAPDRGNAPPPAGGGRGGAPQGSPPPPFGGGRGR